MKINLSINGEKKDYEIDANVNLLDFLRANGYLGAKKGCDDGLCGACTVLVDGKPHNSCILYTAAVAGCEITTIEGIGSAHEPNEIQKAFVESGAVQCGYCTPGMILTTYALLKENPNPTELEIKRELDGNLCRCTGYVKVIDAVKKASEYLKGGSE
ncbi:MAG: (2Fe-2S)-binding protein [Pseudomonadota bacterium]